jgi:hypothetical protein
VKNDLTQEQAKLIGRTTDDESFFNFDLARYRYAFRSAVIASSSGCSS